MSEQPDKPLHDWVRQSLDTYRPEYNPTDWANMQRLLRRRRWWRGGLISCAALLLLGLLGWVILDTQRDNPIKMNQLVFRSKQPLPAVKNSPDPLIRVDHSIMAMNQKSALKSPNRNRAIQPQLLKTLRIIAPITGIDKSKLVTTPLTKRIHHPDRVAFSAEEMAITHQMLTGEFSSDSTSYRTIDRNMSQWPGAVMVCDLTTSMYPYTTQLFAWLKQQAGNPAIQGMVFFTDCDSLGRQTQAGGPPGRMYITRERKAINVLPVLLEAARNTIRNEDDAENDVEALLFAQQMFPEAKHLILLADNLSMVKDMNLLNQIKKPVHVVLCGTTGGHLDSPFQPDYYRIASQTQGSLHTLEDDLNPGEISSRTTLRVGPAYYRYVAGKRKFKRTAFDHRPKRFLGFIWL